MLKGFYNNEKKNYKKQICIFYLTQLVYDEDYQI